MAPFDDSSNYISFRECLSGPLVETFAIKPKEPSKRPRGRSRGTKVTKAGIGKTGADEDNAEELVDFIDYLATEVYNSLPQDFQGLSYSGVQNDTNLAATYANPLPKTTADAVMTTIPPSVHDSLEAYHLLPSATELPHIILPVLQEYISAVTAPPPVWSSTRTSECEICERSWIPLTYHHLIPRQIHAKALKRGWHEEWQLNSVAWLCSACHNFVHRVATNEELAKDWWTVERLMEREDMQAWAKWRGKVRWKAR